MADPVFTPKTFVQLSKHQRKEYERMLRVCRNAARHESSFPSKEDRAKARVHRDDTSGTVTVTHIEMESHA